MFSHPPGCSCAQCTKGLIRGAAAAHENRFDVLPFQLGLQPTNLNLESGAFRGSNEMKLGTVRNIQGRTPNDRDSRLQEDGKSRGTTGTSHGVTPGTHKCSVKTVPKQRSCGSDHQGAVIRARTPSSRDAVNSEK